MAANPRFDALLDKMREVHSKKNHDYAGDDPFSNFKEAAATADCSIDTVFLTMIGIKLARLRELLKGKVPKNESIEDSKLDLAMYAALWTAHGMPHPDDVRVVIQGRHYCTRCGRLGNVIRTYDPKDLISPTCAYCGDVLEPTGGDDAPTRTVTTAAGGRD